ncbi:MAG: rane protein-like protein [Caulobacteraceae bacterium]|nr:rane protein-like protein [Caulobacteraceae bacterium]
MKTKWPGVGVYVGEPVSVHREQQPGRFEEQPVSETEPAPLKKPMSFEELRKGRRPVRNLYKEHRESLKPLERLAVWTTEKVGTMGFFLVIFTWTALWLGWNFLAPKPLRFDPPMGFVFWLFISNVIQILLMPLIMVGQNVQGAHAEIRAEHDLAVNVQAEQEIEVILQHLEYQNNLLLELTRRLRADVSEALDQKI